jgi:hypothetical protein
MNWQLVGERSVVSAASGAYGRSRRHIQREGANATRAGRTAESLMWERIQSRENGKTELAIEHPGWLSLVPFGRLIVRFFLTDSV